MCVYVCPGIYWLWSHFQDHTLWPTVFHSTGWKELGFLSTSLSVVGYWNPIHWSLKTLRVWEILPNYSGWVRDEGILLEGMHVACSLTEGGRISLSLPPYDEGLQTSPYNMHASWSPLVEGHSLQTLATVSQLCSACGSETPGWSDKQTPRSIWWDQNFPQGILAILGRRIECQEWPLC